MNLVHSKVAVTGKTEDTPPTRTLDCFSFCGEVGLLDLGEALTEGEDRS